MQIVVVTGWAVGFEKVSCTKLMRSTFDLGLSDGKAITDSILAGNVQRFELPDGEAARDLVSELTRIRALAHVEPAA